MKKVLEIVLAAHEALPESACAYFALSAEIFYPAVDNDFFKRCTHILLIVCMAARNGVAY